MHELASHPFSTRTPKKAKLTLAPWDRETAVQELLSTLQGFTSRKDSPQLKEHLLRCFGNTSLVELDGRIRHFCAVNHSKPVEFRLRRGDNGHRVEIGALVTHVKEQHLNQSRRSSAQPSPASPPPLQSDAVVCVSAILFQYLH